ncbi:hypothetical protein [Actinopolymorpha pittospori]|uniref:tRNA synthetases class I catalytic domain-containing protein n=1 Tax=Actinopolymorpha pittospori TaxID=648752 RepID=A0A927MQ66_9ACTN|nr:hypothetical protein [Actinopolymorpha pittospori]MBE1604049.1 hypothetical protein [Actinopolymorpha pittospori]
MATVELTDTVEGIPRPGAPSWPTPWGPAGPGWHLGCSTIAPTYLGPTFDIYGGGTDIVFPHHEREPAQSRGAGDRFARYWLHNGLLNLCAQKMSKSIGTRLLITELAKRCRRSSCATTSSRRATSRPSGTPGRHYSTRPPRALSMPAVLSSSAGVPEPASRGRIGARG